MSILDEPETLALTPEGVADQRPRGYSLRHVVQNSALYSISDFVLKLIGFFLVPLYTRAMTPEDYGIIGYTTALTQILSPIVGLGLVGALPVFYYAYTDQERKELISTVVNVAILYSLALTLLLSAAGQPLAGVITHEVSFGYLLLALWGMFFSTFYFLPLGIFNMAERTIAYGVYSVGLSLLNVIANIVLVLVFRLGALGALWAGVISGALGMAVALIQVRPYYVAVFDRRKLAAVCAVSLPILPHLFSGTMLKFADRLFLTGKTTLSETGVYSLAMTIASIALVALAGAATALNPLFYRRANALDPTLQHDWARLWSLFVASALAVGLALALAGPELIRLMTPPRYHAAVPLLPVLVLGQVVTAIYWMVSPAIGFTRKTWIYAAASFPALALNLVLNAALVPRYGAMGAAWTTVITAIVHFGLGAAMTQRFYRVPYEYGQMAKVVVLVAAIFGVSTAWHGVALWTTMAVKIALFALLPLCLWSWNFFEPTELRAAKRGLQRWRLLPTRP